MANPINNPGAIVSNSSPTRIKVPLLVQVLKITSVGAILISILLSVYFTLDMDPNNKYLSVIAYDHNTYTLYEETKQKEATAKQTKTNLEFEETDLKRKIQEEDYSQNTRQIEEIKNQQVNWFDSFDKNGNFKIGLFDLPNHLGNYVNSGQLDEKLEIDNNEITISNIMVNRTNVNFAFKAYNGYGRVFNLTNEFIEFINSLETLEGVSISSFSRTEDDKGNVTMSFNVNAKIQTPESAIDPFDDIETHTLFLEWVETQALGLNNTSSSSSQNQTSPTTQPPATDSRTSSDSIIPGLIPIPR